MAMLQCRRSIIKSPSSARCAEEHAHSRAKSTIHRTRRERAAAGDPRSDAVCRWRVRWIADRFLALAGALATQDAGHAKPELLGA